MSYANYVDAKAHSNRSFWALPGLLWLRSNISAYSALSTEVCRTLPRGLCYPLSEVAFPNTLYKIVSVPRSHHLHPLLPCFMLRRSLWWCFHTFICLLANLLLPMRAGSLCCSLLYHQTLEECLVSCCCLINTCQMNEWINQCQMMEKGGCQGTDLAHRIPAPEPLGLQTRKSLLSSPISFRFSFYSTDVITWLLCFLFLVHLPSQFSSHLVLGLISWFLSD